MKLANYSPLYSSSSSGGSSASSQLFNFLHYVLFVTICKYTINHGAISCMLDDEEIKIK